MLASDSFEDSRSGWATVRQPTYFVGYHAPGWYHLDASAPGVQVLSLLGVQYADVTIKATVSVDRTDSPGRYRYGVAFRAHGPADLRRTGSSDRFAPRTSMRSSWIRRTTPGNSSTTMRSRSGAVPEVGSKAAAGDRLSLTG